MRLQPRAERRERLRDWFDVTSTDPATGLPSTNGFYPTTPGWDYVTGFGTPKVNGLICDIDRVGC